MESPDDAQWDELLEACPHWIRGHGPASTAQLLGDIPSDTRPDRYASGGVVGELEGEVAELLGFDDAVFMPSGTMAQQIAFRIHADLRRQRSVALHPTSHLVLWEDRAHEWLHDLRTVVLGDATSPWTLDDVAAVAGRVSAIGIEVPLRELAGRLPDWDVLTKVAGVAHGAGAAVHLDGARLWEAAAGYDRSPRAVAASADSVYVSFYKGLGGIAGAALVGDQAVVDQARIWVHRHGGRAFALWPYAASALIGLRTRLPRMASYLALARQIAADLADVDGLEVVPVVPDTAMMHLYVRTTDQAFTQATARHCRQDGVATWRGSQPTERPQWRKVELAVGDATVALGADATTQAIKAVVASALAAEGRN